MNALAIILFIFGAVFLPLMLSEQCGTTIRATLAQGWPVCCTASWPKETSIEVYFIENQFTDDEQLAIMSGLNSWPGIKFLRAGDVDEIRKSESCLTIQRHVLRKDRLAEFNHTLGDRQEI